MNLRLKTKLFWWVLMGLLCVNGCGKKEAAASDAFDISGVKVDMPKLNLVFADAAPDLQANVHEASSNLRYGQYEKTLQSLDKLAGNASLSEPQKKTVNDVIEQMKQVIAKAGPARQ